MKVATRENMMMVALVLDPNYGSKLETLVRRMPVWIVNTPVNRSVAEKLWEQHQKTPSSINLSTFVIDENVSLEETCMSILDTIDLHHGEYSSDPPYDKLEVIGTHATASIRKALSSLGFTTIIDSPEGFQASRS